MRILHVSDWHLGRETSRHSRAPDHDAVIAEIIALSREHRPDLIIHTGDLFDVARPGVEDMQRGIAALQELAGIAPTVVICGNHDSPPLFRLFNRILSGPGSAFGNEGGGPSRLTFIDKPGAHGKDGVLTFEIDTGFGQQRLRLASLPFVRDGRIVDTMEDAATWLTSYAERISKIEAALDVALLSGYNPSTDVNLFAAHLHVAGATWSHSERALHVSDTYASTVEAIPTVTYAAFGHIHKPQKLPGLAVGAYAGSPLQLDFGEEGETKRVVLVDADPGRSANIQSIELAAGRRLRSYNGTLEGLVQLADDWGDALTKVIIQSETATPGLAHKVRTLLPYATLLNVEENAADTRLQALSEDDGGPNRSEPTVAELFEAFLAERATTGVPAATVRAAFAPMLAAAEADADVELPAGQDALLDHLAALAARVDDLAEPGMDLVVADNGVQGDSA
jgi:exonuclease SbcD